MKRSLLLSSIAATLFLVQLWNVRGGVLLGCTCQHFAAPPGVGGGTIPTGSASSSSTRKRASKRK